MALQFSWAGAKIDSIHVCFAGMTGKKIHSAFALFIHTPYISIVNSAPMGVFRTVSLPPMLFSIIVLDI